MDRIEDIDRDRAGDRLGERDVNTQRVSEGETEKEGSSMLQDYDAGLSDREYERSPPKLALASEYNLCHSPLSRSPPSPLVMDISSVRFRPVPIVAQAEMTSTHGHPRLNWPEMANVNIYIGYMVAYSLQPLFTVSVLTLGLAYM